MATNRKKKDSEHPGMINKREDSPHDWERFANSWAVRLLRPLGLWLLNRRLVSHVHFEWDLREETGEFWELYGWRAGPIIIPFSGPRRNSVMEMTTPEVLAIWKQLMGHPKFRIVMFQRESNKTED